MFLAAFAARAAFAPPPDEAVKALKITRGKPFSSGVVFIDGKFIEPPYVVERYGNALRINKIQIAPPSIDWSDFLRTQSGAVVTSSAPSPAPAPNPAPAPSPAPAPAPAPAADSLDDPLAALFDDTPAKPTRAAAKKPAPRPAPRPTETVTFSGKFEMNDRSRALVTKVNAARTEIDASLRRGGFLCFGSGYSQVSGDRGTADRILAQLPKIMKDNAEYEPFAAALRQAGFVFFPPKLVRQLFANRIDYLALQRRWKKVTEERQFNQLMEAAGGSGY